MQVKELTENEMLKINGGTIGSQIINAVVKAIETIYNLGRELGSGIRRISGGKYCPLD